MAGIVGLYIDGPDNDGHVATLYMLGEDIDVYAPISVHQIN